MKVDLAKFLALTTMMAAPLVTACDLEDEEETSSSTAAGTSATATAGDTAATGGGNDGTTGGTAGGSASGDSSAGATETADESGGGEEVGDCCTAHGGNGCSVPTISECVCEADTLCCDDEGGWDEVCVSEVDSEGCGMCPAAPPAGEGDCCEAQRTAGCGDAKIEACVCDMDPVCCGDEGGIWDQFCVDQVDSFECGVCAE